MRRSFRMRGCFSGWIPKVGTLGWYAMPLQGMDRERSGKSGNGNTVGAPYRKHHRLCVRMGLFAEVAGSQQLVTRLVAPSSCIQPVTIRGRVQVIRPQEGGRGF